MYVGAGKAFPPRLDVDRDDYFEHDIPDCPDLADSAFLEPLPAAPAAPIGWPYETLPELACADETLMQSSPGPATRIQVINATNETVNVYRLDTNGVRQLVRPLPSNEGLVADTIVNEPFVVSSTTNSCLGIFRAAAGFARAVIR
jgi:hypothetical protein